MKTVLLVLLGFVLLLVIVWVLGFLFRRARMQPYIFVHQILPSEMFGDPVGVLGTMVSETGNGEAGQKLLQQIWEMAGEGLSGEDLVSADGLRYSTEVLGHPNSTAYLVTLPPPLKKPEAYFALMVFDAPGLCSDALRQLRYFVLEYHGESEDGPRTLLGEWVAKENGGLKYADYGSGTPPEPEAFLKRVQAIIEASGSQPGLAGTHSKGIED